jgi:hypothetical protein
MNEALELSPTQLHLVVAPRSARRKMMTAFTARLALVGPVCLLDGGNCFDAYGLAREIRRKTEDWQAALERVHVARAFTCYQVVTLLMETAAGTVSTLGLDLLSTFYDESVSMAERRRLLKVSVNQLKRLARRAEVAVSASPQTGEGEELLAMLEEAADQVWHLEEEVAPLQPRLF